MYDPSLGLDEVILVDEYHHRARKARAAAISQAETGGSVLPIRIDTNLKLGALCAFFFVLGALFGHLI